MVSVKLIVIAVIAYLLGSLNFSVIISKAKLNDDVRNHGSGNAGLTNAYRIMGGKLALLVLFGDFIKGIAAVVAGGLIFGYEGKLVAGVMVLIGHMFPLYFGFKGGKGILTGAAMALIIDWRVFLVLICVFAVTVVITRFVSLSSILATIAFPVSMFIFHGDILSMFMSVSVAILIIYRHRSNIFRLASGKEPKFNFKRKDKNA